YICGLLCVVGFFFFSSRRRHTRSKRDWSSDVCSSDLPRRAGSVCGQQSATAQHRLRPWVATPELPVRLHLRAARPAGQQRAAEEIGRASCRERGQDSGGGASRKNITVNSMRWTEHKNR